MTEKILLRTMTLKSKFTDGKYAGKTVEEILKGFNNFNYLRWVYYNIQNITFTDDILHTIGIIGEWCINKPGADKVQFANRTRAGYGKMYQVIKDTGIITKRQKTTIKAHTSYKKDRIKKAFNSVRFSKAQLQSLNHGRTL